MLFEVIKIQSVCFFLKKSIPGAVTFLLVFASQVCSQPISDNYTVTSRNFVDSIQNSSMQFDNIYSTATSDSGLTKIKESVVVYTGIPAGVQVQKAGGENVSISSWSESGYVIEFTVSTVDGKFISYSPFKSDWGIRFEDIDLLPAEGATPEVLGVYFDFTSSTQELAYNLDPLLLSSVPVGVGKHPFENNDVIYATATGTEFSDYAIATIVNNKLKLDLDSASQFESFSLESIARALGVTVNFNQAPTVNRFKIGVLIKGIQVTQFSLLAGDYNCDLIVNAADYTVWRDNYGATGVGPCKGDGDYDGDVDGNDFLVWQRNYGSVYVPPPAAVVVNEEPESPAGIVSPDNMPVEDSPQSNDNVPENNFSAGAEPNQFPENKADAIQAVAPAEEVATDVVKPVENKKKKPKTKNKTAKEKKGNNKKKNKKAVKKVAVRKSRIEL